MMRNPFRPTFLRFVAWAFVLGGVLALYSQPWSKKDPALEQLKDQWVSAHQTKNAAAMEALFYGNTLSDEMRSRWRTVIIQEFDFPLHAVKIKPITDAMAFPATLLDSGFTPVAQMTVSYDDPNHFTVTYLIGKDSSGIHKILLFSP
jgi:hypothetical protein